MLNYMEDGAETSGSEYATGGSSAFEDEAAFLWRKMMVCRILGVVFLRPPIKKRMRTRGKIRANVNKTGYSLNAGGSAN